jgi:hypothetical protein
MVEFLNATQTFGEIQSIINQATNQSSIVMISPYIKVNDLILSRLIDAGGNRGVRITMICRGNDLKPEELTRLEQIPSLTICYDEHVHAKCFYNNERMVIGSLNLYDSSAGINHEMAVLLRNDLDADREAFQAAKNEAQFIMRNTKSYVQQNRELKPIVNTPPNPPIKQIEPKVGHCIHCGTEITFDIDAPYCSKCWKTWKRYKNRAFPESICHTCGHPASTSMNNPRCPSCR